MARNEPVLPNRPHPEPVEGRGQAPPPLACELRQAQQEAGLSFAVAAGLILSLIHPARAAEPPKKPGAEQYFNISPVGVPVISNGRLVNYVFVVLRLNIRPGLDPTTIAKKEPFFRDALVRLSHRAALNPPRDFNRLDDRTVKAKMMAESARIAGPGVVTSVEILSQTPQHRLDAPTP